MPKNGTPGPGTYAIPPSLTRNGSYFVSQYKSSRCRGFGKDNRITVNFNKSAQGNPGPGSYRLPSEFGYYESRYAASQSARNTRLSTQANPGFRKTK